MIKEILEEELAFEKQQLKRVKAQKTATMDVLLLYSKRGFYYRKKGKRKRIYIRKCQQNLLRQITSSKYIRLKADILSDNISILEKALKSIKNTEDEEIIKSLPKTYQKAISELRSSVNAGGIIQSQNGYYKENLTIVASNGLRVRTREELIIAEILIDIGIKFQYEKALTLSEEIRFEDGSITYSEVTVYPDFTIFLADGTEFYLEHCGMLSDSEYCERFFRKLRLYFENGIYSPKNLLITMAGEGMPIDTIKIRQVIMTQILPFC